MTPAQADPALRDASPVRPRRAGIAATWAAAAILVAAAIFIAAWPEAPAQALVSPESIVVSPGFSRDEVPRDYEVRESIRTSPKLWLWRSWNPEQKAVPATAATPPFPLPRHLLVPYKGFAGEPGVRIVLECVADGRRLDVATARTNNQWSEATVTPGSGWCKGKLGRLVVESTSRSDYVAFGTPFGISTLSWLKLHFAGLVAPWLLVLLGTSGLCLGAAAWARRAWPEDDGLAPALIALGLAGYATFFIFDANHAAGVAWSLAVGILAVLGWVSAARRHAGRGPTTPWATAMDATIATWRLPLLAWATVSLAYLALLFALDNGAGPWLANARFSPARWSSDNQLPMLSGEYLARLQIRDLSLSPWLLADRTPLSYGLHALLRRWSLLLVSRADGYATASAIHATIGIVLNTLWVPVTVHIGRSLGLSRGKLLALVLACAALPFCLFNSIYIWPKLLGGTFGLLAIWLLVARPVDAAETASAQARRWTQAALLSALALLCHGGTVFGIVAMLALAVPALGWPRWRSLAMAGIGAIALLAPWMAWQRLVQPNANALLKSLLAGTYGFDAREVGVLDTVRQAYAALGPGQWWDMKLAALNSLFLPATYATCGAGEMVQDARGLSFWRIVDFASLAPSIKFLWLGLVPIAFVLARRQATTQARATAWLLGTGLLGVAIQALVAWDCQIIHTQSYQALLAIVVALAAGLVAIAPRWLMMLGIGGSVAWCAVVWIVHPLAAGARIDPLSLGVLVALAAWLCRAGYVHARRPLA